MTYSNGSNRTDVVTNIVPYNDTLCQVKGGEKLKIGYNIRKLRIKLGLSQSEFARRVYVTPSYINRIEVGIRTPSAEVIERIAVIFHVSTDSLFFGQAV